MSVELHCPDWFRELGLPILLIDSQGRIIHSSPRAETALSAFAGALKGRKLASLLSPRNPGWLCDEIRRNAPVNGWSGDALLVGLDGKECWFHVQACRFPTEQCAGRNVMLVIEDISGQVELMNVLMRRGEELFQRSHELETVNKLGKMLLTSTNLEYRLSATVCEAAKVVGVSIGGIFLINNLTKTLECAVQHGLPDGDCIKTVSVGLNARSIVSRVARTGKPYIAEDIQRERTVLKKIVSGYRVKSALYVPIIAEDRVLGVLLLAENTRRRSFSAEEITLVQIMANLAASAIHSSAITEESRRAARLAAAGELLAGATHNIGNALMAVRGTMEVTKIIAQDKGAPEEIAARLDQAIQYMGKGSDIVHRLLEFARGGQTELAKVSLRHVAMSAIALCQAHPDARDRNIKNLISAGTPLVSARQGPLTEVIFNLLLNSLQATEPGGEICLEADHTDGRDYVDLRLSDNGCGMSQEVAERAFEPFFSTKNGTGLGLSSSLSILREMGGTIGLDTAPGRGAAFTIRLEIAQPDIRQRAA